ncbi:MAG TPA: hypothetical protein VJ731_17980 [Terriglobales bacterium]|nr:hypothetical protein [Terriglobales bacterium]
MAGAAKSSPAVLNSWKEIAAYLDRGVRTVQRWERELHLPVHRIGKGSRSPVYALVAELKFWLTTLDIDMPSDRQLRIVHSQAVAEQSKQSPLEISHRLIAQSHDLVRRVAETSVRQQRQAELLQKRLTEIRSRMR